MLSVYGSMALNMFEYNRITLPVRESSLAFQKRAHELLTDSSVNTVV